MCHVHGCRPTYGIYWSSSVDYVRRFLSVGPSLDGCWFVCRLIGQSLSCTLVGWSVVVAWFVLGLMLVASWLIGGWLLVVAWMVLG